MDEKTLIAQAISSFEDKLKQISSIDEKQVALFYYHELKNIIPCPETEQFKKPGKGIGGFGDKMVFQKMVCRDSDNHPIIENSKLKTKTCAFQSMESYINFITQDKTPKRQPLSFYDGMPLEDYVQWQNIMFSRNRFI